MTLKSISIDGINNESHFHEIYNQNVEITLKGSELALEYITEDGNEKTLVINFKNKKNLDKLRDLLQDKQEILF